MLQDPPPDPDGNSRTRRRPRLSKPVTVIGVVVIVLAALVAVALHNAGGYYVFAPGTAPMITTNPKCAGPSQLTLPGGAPCVRITMPARLVHPISGKMFMVDVEVGRASGVDYALNEVGLLHTFKPNEQLIPAKEYTGGLSPAQVQCANVAQMTGSQEAAPVAALRRLGYQVPQVDKGAVVEQVSAGSAAARAGLHCNDVITAIDGKAVHTAPDLAAAIHALKPGQVATIERQVTGTDGKTKTSEVHATLTTTPASVAKRAGESPSTAFLGVSTVTDTTFHLPFPVSIDAGDIGGPSAGLAFTLGIINLLSGGHLTGGLHVAATGEIEPSGAVLEVGGVAQKTIAVQRAGASVFIVPKGDYAAAESKANGKVKIYPVTTLDQALAVLAKLGGEVPPTNFATSHPVSSLSPSS